MPRLRKALKQKPAATWGKFAEHIEKVGRKVGRPKKVMILTDEHICLSARAHMRELNAILRSLLERHISTEVVRSTEDGGPFQLKFTKAL